MKHSKAILTIRFCVAASVGHGQTPDTSTKPDDTKVNKRDRNSSEATADQQKENSTDRAMTKRIRQSIMADK